MKLLPMMITQMQRSNTIVALGGMFLLLQVFSFIAHVRGSGRKADDVLQLEDNPCRPINFNGRMIPTVPEYMPSFPGSVKGIKRHFVCRPVEPTTTPAMTTQNPTSSSSTTKKTTTTSSSTTKKAETASISTTDSTTTNPPTTIPSSTTKEPEATTISRKGPTTTDPPTTTTSTTTTEAEAVTISTMSSTTTDPPTTTTSSTDRESTTISTTDSTTSGSTTTTVSPTTQDTTTMSTTMESTTSDPTTREKPTVRIFVTDEGTDGKIFVADLQDQLSFTYIPSTVKPRFITYDSVDKKIYWTDEHDRRVYRADVDGGNRETVTHEGSSERRGIAIAETSRTLYIATKGLKTITSVLIGEGSTIPGDETEFVTSLSGEPISLEVAEGYLYWTDTLGKIRRKLLDGSGVIKDLYTDPSLSKLSGLSIGPSSGDSLYIFICDYGQEKTFYLEVASVSEIYSNELTSYLQASNGGTKLRDITYFNSVLYWTKEADPSSITVMTDYQSARSYEIKETSGIGKPYQLLITNVYP